MNPFTDMLAYHFMANAFRAGTVVAVVAGLVGWFMVLRRQSFAGHTLALVAFPGAAAATVLGLSVSLGYLAFSVAAAVIIALAPGSGRQGNGRQEAAVIGTVQALALATGYWLVGLYKGSLTGVNSLLFGNFLGITDGQVGLLVILAAAVMLVLAVIGRPLLFATVSPDVASAKGVRSRGLGILFLVLLGVAAAEASQITGVLLVFALLVLPAATAQRLTSEPGLSLVLTVLLGIMATWAGLVAAYYYPYPVGFFITSFAFVGYLLARAWGDGRSRRLQKRMPA